LEKLYWSVGSKAKWSMLCSPIYVAYQQYWHSQINSFFLLSLFNEVWITLQKKILKLMIGVKSCNSCRDLFKTLEILTLPLEYIFRLINFITNKEEYFQANADVHSVNTRHKHYIHKSTANISCFQNSTYYARIKSFNNLSPDLKSFMSEKA
jgi:hypothetical protein